MQLKIAEEKIRPEATFSSPGADDLDFVETVMTAEEERMVSIPDDLLVRISGAPSAKKLADHITIAKLAEALDKAEPQAETSGEIAAGRYPILIKQPLPDGNARLFEPSLLTILKNAQSTKGQSLTEQEVLSLRNHTPAMVAPTDVILNMNETRGYQDIDPKSPRADWQKRRTELKQSNSQR